jgi:hypothetical protein
MSDHLADWELATIDALATEALEKASRSEFIQHEDRWLDRQTRDLQTLFLGDQVRRRGLRTQADRLGIGIVHPPRVDTLPPLPIADDTLASRWCRITLLKLRTPAEHEWSILFADIVTRHVSTHRHTALPWTPADQGLGIIDLLEIEATRHGLIAGDAPSLTATQVADALVGAAA